MYTAEPGIILRSSMARSILRALENDSIFGSMNEGYDQKSECQEKVCSLSDHIIF